MAGLVNGTDLIVYVKRFPLGYIPIAFSTSCELQIESDIIDQTNKDSDAWRDIILGARSYTIDVDSLYENNRFGGFMDMFTNLDNALEVDFEFKLRPTSDKKYNGKGLIVSLVLKGDTEVGAEYKMFLAGNGSLTEL